MEESANQVGGVGGTIHEIRMSSNEDTLVPAVPTASSLINDGISNIIPDTADTNSSHEYNISTQVVTCPSQVNYTTTVAITSPSVIKQYILCFCTR